MQHIENKFQLDDTLNQIYQNNYQCDSEYIFLSYDASFILLNDLYIYISDSVKIKLIRDYMQINTNDTVCEILYSNIKTFSIHSED